jgi:hypothetical protein
MIKTAIIAAASAAGGFVLGYFAAKKKIEDTANLEVEEIRVHYLNALREKDEPSGGDVEVKVDPVDFGYVPDAEKSRMASDILSYKNREKPDIIHYSVFSREEDAAESEHPEDEDMPTDEEEVRDLEPEDKANREIYEWQKKRKLKEPPKLISAEEFSENNLMDKETLYFYFGDGVLTTADDEIVDDPENLVGDALTKYGFNTNDEKVIYVRNVRIDTDFEIQKVDSLYSDMAF